MHLNATDCKYGSKDGQGLTFLPYKRTYGEFDGLIDSGSTKRDLFISVS
jgi:hypothetical protein